MSNKYRKCAMLLILNGWHKQSVEGCHEMFVHPDNLVTVELSKEDEEMTFLDESGDFLHLPRCEYALLGALIHFKQLAVNYKFPTEEDVDRMVPTVEELDKDSKASLVGDNIIEALKQPLDIVVKISNPTRSAAIQAVAFELGYVWVEGTGGKGVSRFTDKPYLLFHGCSKTIDLIAKPDRFDTVYDSDNGLFWETLAKISK